MIRARCHKSIRRAARARVFSSESWTRQYKKARGGWQYYFLIALGIFFFPFLLIAALFGFPGGAGFLFATGTGGTREVISVVVALVSAVVGCGHGGWLLRELVSSRSLAVASQLPVSDNEFLTNRTHFTLKASLVFLLVLLSFFVAAAIGLEVGLTQSAMVAGLAIIQWSLIVSLSLILPAWFPKLVRAEAVGGIVSLGVMVVVASITLAQLNVIQLDAVRLVALSVLPTGWVFLLLEFGILGNVAMTAWMLVPCLLTVLVASRAYVRIKGIYPPGK